MPFLRFEQVVKDFAASAAGPAFRAVDHVSLDIEQGEIFALLGSSGCGKTTLLRLLAGFDQPTSGRMLLQGQDLALLPPYERPLNMMFQSYALFPHLSVWENIAFGLKRQGLPKDQVAQQVEAMLKLVQLTAFAQRKPRQLSGGQQQRVALARSLARQPSLLLLDEPLGALDKKLREETQIELVHILRSVGVTCVMVTHDQEEAMTMASRMAVMNEGRLLQVGTPRQIYETPATRFVADFIGNVNLLDDHVAVRPEKIHLSRPVAGDPPQGGDQAAHQVLGLVRDVAYFGSYTVYHLSVANGKTLKVSQSNTHRQPQEVLQVGEQVWASWSDSAQVVLSS